MSFGNSGFLCKESGENHKQQVVFKLNCNIIKCERYWCYEENEDSKGSI